MEDRHVAYRGTAGTPQYGLQAPRTPIGRTGQITVAEDVSEDTDRPPRKQRVHTVPEPGALHEEGEPSGSSMLSRSSEHSIAKWTSDSVHLAIRRSESFADTLGQRALPHYLQVTVCYLVVLSLVSTAAVCGADPEHIGFTDGLYLSVSAVSMTGLSSVDLASRKRGVSVVLWFTMIFGSPMLLSTLPAFMRRLHAVRERRKLARDATSPMPQTRFDDSDTLALATVYRTVCLYWLVSQLVGWWLLWALLGGARLGDSWDALFLATASWHNCGFTTLPDLPLRQSRVAPWVLLVLMVLILLGNSFFPVALRYLVYLNRRLTQDPLYRQVLTMLLRHPRSCYMYLFPFRQTMWLAMANVGLVVAQICALCLTQLWAEPASGVGDSPMLVGLSLPERLLAVAFQAVSTRSAGFSVLDLGLLSPAAAFVFMVCMWISMCPIVVVMRSTNEESEALKDGAEEEQADDSPWHSMVKSQLTRFMSDDSMWLLALFFIIMLAEEYATTKDDSRSSSGFIYLVFEFCSAYGNAGLSMSPTGKSVSSNWTWVSKLSITFTMFLGRLRGLPEAIDPAVRFTAGSRLEVPRWTEERAGEGFEHEDECGY